MKVKRLLIKNVGIVKDSDIPLDKPLILFYGEIRQGKTTHLNAVRWVFGGSFPQDIIRHGEKEAGVTLEFEDGEISREWYRAKDGSTKAREITFIRDGKPVDKPASEIKKFLNPFLLDQDYLRKMGEAERKKYFTELFSVDTAEIDKEIEATESEARELRAKVKGYGDIDLNEVKPVEVEPLREELSRIRQAHDQAVNEVDEKNRGAIEHNQKVTRAKKDKEAVIASIVRLEQELKEAIEKKEKVDSWIERNPLKTELPRPSRPDTSELESQVSNASASQVRYEQYLNNVERAGEKKEDEKKIIALEKQYKKLKADKTAALANIAESSGIKGLVFDEWGNFTYQGTTAGMLSGSQIEVLTQELSGLYPKDLGISLIDRAESLGKSIFTFIDRAKEENKAILAAIVGERPAKVPPEVGVWVVKEGIAEK